VYPANSPGDMAASSSTMLARSSLPGRLLTQRNRQPGTGHRRTDRRVEICPPPPSAVCVLTICTVPSDTSNHPGPYSGASQVTDQVAAAAVLPRGQRGNRGQLPGPDNGPGAGYVLAFIPNVLLPPAPATSPASQASGTATQNPPRWLWQQVRPESRVVVRQRAREWSLLPGPTRPDGQRPMSTARLIRRHRLRRRSCVPHPHQAPRDAPSLAFTGVTHDVLEETAEHRRSSGVRVGQRGRCALDRAAGRDTQQPELVKEAPSARSAR